jgi:hypothetical protein
MRVGPLARKSARLLGRGGERSSSLLRSRERLAKLGARWSQSRWYCSVRCLSLTPQRVDGTPLWGLNVPRFIPVGAARRRPLEGGVAVMLHVHWLGGSTPG